jgi:uncharacterized protein YcnI
MGRDGRGAAAGRRAAACVARRPAAPVPGRVITLVAGLVGALVVAVLAPGRAAADVTVDADRAEAGARDVTIVFRVTADGAAAPVTRLQVFLPTARPLLGVAARPPAGWTVRVTTAAPPAPAALDGTPVTAVPVAVTWEGGPLAGPDAALFPVRVARLPDGAGPLRFRVLQTDARGGTVEWSDLLPVGAPPPAHPALVLPYGGVPVPPPAAGGPHHHGDAPDLALPVQRAGLGAFLVVAALVTAAAASAVAALGGRQARRMAALRRRDRP